MSQNIPFQPLGYHSITPYLVVKDAVAAIDFYTRAFNAQEIFRLATADGQIGHAEIKIGDSMVMLSDEFPEWGALGPQSIGGSPCSMMIYVPDVDAMFAQAVTAGATVKMPLADHFYGDRSGRILDPFGHVWMLATHTEDVPPDEINRRSQAQFGMTYHAGK